MFCEIYILELAVAMWYFIKKKAEVSVDFVFHLEVDSSAC